MRPIKKQSQQRAVSLASTTRKGGGNVRIIAGLWRRSVLPVADAAGLRPTGDRVRETLFNWLNHLFGNFEEVRGLDLFAGSGALGFELASRGATHVTLIEKNRTIYQTLCKNRDKLHATTLNIICDDAITYLERNHEKFDIIFIDPPFALNLHEKAISTAIKRLTPGGLLYVEAPKEWLPECLERLNLEVLRESSAGNVTYRLVKPNLAVKGDVVSAT